MCQNVTYNLLVKLVSVFHLIWLIAVIYCFCLDFYVPGRSGDQNCTLSSWWLKAAGELGGLVRYGCPNWMSCTCGPLLSFWEHSIALHWQMQTVWLLLLNTVLILLQIWIGSLTCSERNIYIERESLHVFNSNRLRWSSVLNLSHPRSCTNFNCANRLALGSL